MSNTVIITAPAGVKTLGLRSSARPFAEELQKALDTNNSVTLDFSSLEVTQGFVDGLMCSQLLKEGADGLKRITFINCTLDTQAKIRFVARDRLAQRSTQPGLN